MFLFAALLAFPQVPVRAEPVLAPILTRPYCAMCVELYDPERTKIGRKLLQELWRAAAIPEPPGRGGSVAKKRIEGEALQHLLAALHLRAEDVLFAKRFAPDAGGAAIRLPVGEIAAVEAQFVGPEPPALPATLAEARLCSLRVDVAATIAPSPAATGWTGIAWLAPESPYGATPMRNLAWKAAKPLFAEPPAKWEAASAAEGVSLLRATAPDGAYLGLYLESAGGTWQIYDFTAQPAPADPDHPRPDPEPAALALKAPFRVLLQIGEPQGEFTHLVLVDEKGAARDVPLPWGLKWSTGE